MKMRNFTLEDRTARIAEAGCCLGKELHHQENYSSKLVPPVNPEERCVIGACDGLARENSIAYVTLRVQGDKGR